MQIDKILEIIETKKWKHFPELICQQCHSSNPRAFDKLYYIESGGHLPEGWIIWCKECISCFEATIISIRKNDET